MRTKFVAGLIAAVSAVWVLSGQQTAPQRPAAMQTYTVQSGDTLSSIAKRLLGNAGDYMEIYNANRDQLTDPDKIKPGQVLKLPQAVRK